MVGPPKKRLLPLFLLSFLAIFFFFSYHDSSLPTQTFTPLSTPPASLNPHSTPFTFLIKVLAFNRLHSVSRCLRSLSAVDYGADTVHLHVYIDHFPSSSADESLDVLGQKLRDSRGILEFVDGYDWKFGDKVVHYRTANVGLQAQWLEAWWPSSDDEFAFVVEDDLEVSPLFYKFVKGVIVNYYYNVSNFSPSVYGVSLQRPRFVPGKHGNKIQLDSETRLFLYQLVGTWGQILFPKPWKEFRLWYDDHKAKGIKPVLDGMVTTGWYKRMGERIWTPWFIKFIHSRGYFNIYTNFQHERALSVSHRDAGVNYGKNAGPDSKLLDKSSLDFNLLEMQPLSDLKWYDFCFKELFPGRVVKSLDELGAILPSVQKQQSILLVSIHGAEDSIARNMICHFERLNIQNYIFMGSHSDFLFDLARRGHPVIDADELLNSIKAHKLISFQDSSVKDILAKAYVIKKSLEYGYNTWIMDAKMLLVNQDLFHELRNPADDFYAGRSSEFFIVRSSSSAQKIWTDGFLNKIVATAGKVSSPAESRTFVHIVVKLLEQNGVRINRVDETSFGTEINASSVSQSSLPTMKKMVYWSRETGLDLIQKRLQELSLWAIDSDSSCTAVVCHRS